METRLEVGLGGLLPIQTHQGNKQTLRSLWNHSFLKIDELLAGVVFILVFRN
jgi:hypothetical protein